MMRTTTPDKLKKTEKQADACSLISPDFIASISSAFSGTFTSEESWSRQWDLGWRYHPKSSCLLKS